MGLNIACIMHMPRQVSRYLSVERCCWNCHNTLLVRAGAVDAIGTICAIDTIATVDTIGASHGGLQLEFEFKLSTVRSSRSASSVCN